MKKYIVALLVAVSLTLISQTTALALECGDWFTTSTHGKCGAEGGCPNGKICVNTWGAAPICEDAGARCDNKDSTYKVCGFGNSTGGYCGGLGGCADGYECDGTANTCVQKSRCDHVAAPETERQCGIQLQNTANGCGTSGGCEYGYRCRAETEGGPLLCLPDPAGTTNMCPGTPTEAPVVLACGQKSTNPNSSCNCTANGNQIEQYSTATEIWNCCGWADNGSCAATDPALGEGGGNPPPAEGGGNPPPAQGGEQPVVEDDGIDIFAGPSSDDFADLNPLTLFSTDAQAAAAFKSPGGIISRILLFAFPLAGLILFVMLVWSGFQIIAGAAQGSKAIEAGRQRATAAIVGFILLFVSYWIIQVIEAIFSIAIF